MQVQGRYTEAATMYRETLEVQTRVLGQEHLDTLAMVMNLANALKAQG